MSAGAAAAARVLASASAPGRLELSGSGGGPRLCVALDRRAECRVEQAEAGLAVEARESLTRISARDAAELVARAPGSFVAQALALLGAPPGLRIVTDWKLPSDAGISGEAALALAVSAALTRALGQEREPRELLALARDVAARAGRSEPHGFEPALRGVALLTDAKGASVEPLGVDPGRIGESLLVVDPGGADEGAAATGEPMLSPAQGDASEGTTSIVEALRAGRYEDVVELIARESEGIPARPAQGRVTALVRGSGGAARPLAPGRLVAVWAPPGERGPGRREAVVAALKAAGLKPLTVRVDLRGLEIE